MASRPGELGYPGRQPTGEVRELRQSMPVAKVRRKSAKVLLFDLDGMVLLLSGVDPTLPSHPPFWFPVGGGIESGETIEEAAIREVEEETGLVLFELGPVVMTRQAYFEFEGDFYDQEETYFAVRTGSFVPDSKGWTETEQRVLGRPKWWHLNDLRSTKETIYPEGLAEIVEQLLGSDHF